MKKLTLLGIFLLLVATLVFATVTTTGNPLSGNPGETVEGTFILETNDTLSNVSFSASPIFGGDNIDVLTSVTNIAAGETRAINYQVTIPESQSAGNYTGSIAIMAENESGEEFVAGTYEFTITVNEYANLKVSAPSSIELEPGESKWVEFTLKNTGNIEISNLSFNYTTEDLTDEDSDEITLEFPEETINLAPGEEKTIEVRVSSDSEMYIDDYSTTITIFSGDEELNSFDLQFEVDTTLFRKIQLDLNSDQELDPGDDLEFDVELTEADFDMEDVRIKVWIVDLDDGDDVYAESDKFDIDRNDDESESFTFNVPLNVDKGYYDIKVRIKGEDADDPDRDFTIYKVFENAFEVVKDVDEEADFESLIIFPEQPQCGKSFTVTTKVVNTGDEDLDDMYLRLYIPELDIEKISEKFDLDSDRYDDREKSEDFVLTLPTNITASEYIVKIYAYTEDGTVIGVASQSFTPTGECGTDNAGTTETGNEQNTENGNENSNIQYLPTGSAISNLFDKETVQITFWTLGVVALLVIIIYFITLIFKQK